MSITIHKRPSHGPVQHLALTTFLFPGGESGVKLDTQNLRYMGTDVPFQTITARITSAVEVMELVMVVDALRRLDSTPIRLFMPYVPYGRQDRVCVPGEAFSIKAFAALVDSLGFALITMVDPHSEVTPAVFHRTPIRVITQFDVINRYQAFTERVLKGVTFVSPDAGANKKTSELAKYYGHSEFIRADKRRNLATGEIVETVVYTDNLNGLHDVAINDDLIDGGRTFIELAKALKTKGARKVILYATHGIFSKGLKPLFNGGIDEIFTTNSFYSIWPGGIGIERATVLDLDETFPQ